jgi:hypothetical protein
MYAKVLGSYKRDAGQFLLGVLFVIALGISFPRVYATDEVQYYSWIRSVWFDHDVNFENEYRTFARLNPKSGINESLLQQNRVRPKTKLYGNIAPIGSAILWAPWFIGTDVVLRSAQFVGIGLHIPADGYSWPYQRAVCYSSAFYAFVGLLIVRRFTQRWAQSWHSTVSTVAFWLATPLVFYMTVQMPFAHANGFFVSALFVRSWLWHMDKPDRKLPWVAIGATLGALFLVREQLVLFAVIPLVSEAFRFLRFPSPHVSQGIRNVQRYIICAVTAMIVVSPQFVAYMVLNGQPSPASEVSSKLNWCSPHAIDTLIDFDPSPEPICGVIDEPVRIPAWSRGALVWSPILLFGIVGLLLFARAHPHYGIPMLAAFILQVWLNGAFGTTWHLSGAFGFRRYIECTPFFVVGGAYLLQTIKQRQVTIIALGVVGLLILWNMGLIMNGTVFNGLTNVRRGLQWPQLWEWQMSLPQRLWELGGAFFDRCRVLKNGC